MAADWTALLEAVQNLLSLSPAMGVGQLGANEPTLAELPTNGRCRPLPDLPPSVLTIRRVDPHA
jgi:hypothetical protein